MIEVWAKAASVVLPGLSDLPPEIQDRDADVWEALIAVADAVGGEWPARARAAAIALISEAKEREPSLGIRLLTDLRTVFGDASEMPSKAILAALSALPESPWGDMRGKPLDERGLANRLRQYGVKPKTVRIGQSTPRGYVRADLAEPWSRYLPPPSFKAETNKTSETSKTGETDQVSDLDSVPVADVLDVADSSGEKRAIDPDGWTFQLEGEIE